MTCVWNLRLLKDPVFPFPKCLRLYQKDPNYLAAERVLQAVPKQVVQAAQSFRVAADDLNNSNSSPVVSSVCEKQLGCGCVLNSIVLNLVVGLTDLSIISCN